MENLKRNRLYLLAGSNNQFIILYYFFQLKLQKKTASVKYFINELYSQAGVKGLHFVEKTGSMSIIACKQAFVQGPLQALLSRPRPSYSKLNLGKTHTESLFAGYECKGLYKLSVIVENTRFVFR